MAMQTKISLLYLVTAILLLCQITLPQASAKKYLKYHYGRPRASAAYRLRSGVECNDEPKGHATCTKLVKELGYKVCYTEIQQLKRKLERSCGNTCKFCGSPPKSCRTTTFRCCWDGYTTAVDVYKIKGCPVCKDHLRLCRRFKKFCNKDSQNGAFMELHCPMTCGKCLEKSTVRNKGLKIKMSDWAKL